MSFNAALRCTLFASLFALVGCGGLFGGGDKATLYRFGDNAPPVADEARAQAGTGQVLQLLYPGVSFQPASRGDRILTVTDAQVGYVAGARWVSPASTLFDATMVRELERLSPGIRVVRIGESPAADYVLAIDMRRFEAVYSRGQEAAPDVVVDARMKLIRRADRAIIGEWPVTHSEPAQENRVALIVAAFDRGTAAVAAQIAGRTQQVLASQ